MRKRVLKFRYNPGDGKIFIKYECPSSASSVSDVFTMESCEAPVQELKDALQKMRDHVIDICEFPPPMNSGITIRGVTITYNDDDIQGLVITALRGLTYSNAPLIVNTPHFTREPYSEGADPDMNVFSTECAEDLDGLERLAFLYVGGQRAQQELDLGPAVETEEDGAAVVEAASTEFEDEVREELTRREPAPV